MSGRHTGGPGQPGQPAGQHAGGPGQPAGQAGGLAGRPRTGRLEPGGGGNGHLGHGHGGRGGGGLGGSATRLLAVLLVPFAVATVVGLVVLWPGHREYPVPVQFAGPGGAQPQFVTGSVDAVENGPCRGDRRAVCQTASVRLAGGPDAGTYTTLEFGAGPGGVRLQTGERVRLAVTADPASGAPVYAFVDILRGVPLGLVAGLFVLVVVLVARWRGLAALLGLGVAYGVLIWFVLPALLAGRPPLAVGLVGGSAILFAVLYLAHGPSARTSTALLGTLLSLALAGALAAVFTAGTHLTGLSSDVVVALQTAAPQVSFPGLVLCGVVVGALGVLNDVTVTQASAVWELHAADPVAGARRLFSSAMRIGRDHIASSVYTLVLAYAGSALPLLLLVDLSRQPAGMVLTGDEVAAELLRGLIGATALVASVPITTALAAHLVTRPGTGRARARRR